MTSDTMDKARGVLLAALMVLSVFAGAAAFTGTAAAQEVTSADRTIESTTAQPGDTVEVTIDVELSEDGGVQISDEFPTELDAEIVDGLGNLDNVQDGSVTFNDVAGDSSQYTVTYAVTIPDGATDGDTYDFSGTVQASTSASITGDSTIEVSEEATEPPEDDQSIDTDESFTNKFTSGERYWVGQTLLLNDDSEDARETLRLYTVERDSSGEYFVDAYRGDVPLDENGEEIIDTGDLNPDDRYVVTTSNADEVVMATNGNVTDYATPESGNIRQASFTLTEQTLSAAWDDTSTNNEGDDPERYMNELEVSSNRGDYTLWLTAPGLDTQDFEDIFGDDEDFLGTFTFEGTDYLVLAGTTSETYDADFRDIDAGEYQFNTIVSDTFDVDTATVEVMDLDLNFNLQPDVVENEAGDWVSYTVDVSGTDEAYVVFGGPEVNYLTRIKVQDADDNGVIEFEMNTAKAGAVANPDDVFRTEDDAILMADRPRPGAFSDEESTFYIPDQVEEGLDDRQFIDSADYTVTVSRNSQLEESGGDLVIPGEETAGVMILDPGKTTGLSTYVIPSGENADDLEAIEENAVETNYVARGDYLVTEMEASGISGFVDEREDFIGDAVPEVFFAFLGSDKVNENLPAFAEGRLVSDRTNDTYYIVFNTGDLTEAEYPAEDYLALLDISPPLRASDQLNTDLSGNNENDTERTISQVSLEEPSASVDGVVDEELHLQSGDSVTLTGTTNVAPGAEITVQLRSEDNILRERATIAEDGTWEVTYDDFGDFSADTEFELTVRRAGRSLYAVDGMVVTPSDAQISNFDAPSSVESGMAVTASATISNDGGSSVTDTVEWVVAGDTVKSQEITLEAGESVDVEFTISSEGLAPGDYEHSLMFGDLSESATLTIEEEETRTPRPTATDTIAPPPTATPTEASTPTPEEVTVVVTETVEVTQEPTEEPTTTEGGDGPGFGIAVALVALLAAAFLAVRRQD